MSSSAQVLVCGRSILALLFRALFYRGYCVIAATCQRRQLKEIMFSLFTFQLLQFFRPDDVRLVDLG